MRNSTSLVYVGLWTKRDRKYQFMEANNQRRVTGLKDKIPDIQKTVDTVRFFQTRKVSGCAKRLAETCTYYLIYRKTRNPSKRLSS